MIAWRIRSKRGDAAACMSAAGRGIALSLVRAYSCGLAAGSMVLGESIALSP
jgi:hypothetical protein